MYDDFDSAAEAAMELAMVVGQASVWVSADQDGDEWFVVCQYGSMPVDGDGVESLLIDTYRV